MNTIEQHNEEVVKEFDSKFNKLVNLHRGEVAIVGSDYLTYTIPKDSRNQLKAISDFIQSKNKQLYIKIAVDEINRLNDKIEKYYSRQIHDSIVYWQNILTELRK